MGRIQLGLYRIECEEQNTIWLKNVDLKSKFRYPVGSF